MKNEEMIPGIQYCKGWRDFEGMGITVVGGYESENTRYRTFSPQQNPLLLNAAIQRAEYVVTFNGFNFDGPLLKHFGCEIPEAKHLDLLRLIWQAHKMSTTFEKQTHSGYGLDACAIENGVLGKTGNGAMAPIMWQRGQYCEVIDYCLHDIWITKRILEKMLAGSFRSPKTKKLCQIYLPLITL